MGAFLGHATILLLWLARLTLAVKSVDVLSGGIATGIQEEEILRVLAQNKTDRSDNFTFIELIGSVSHQYNNSLNTDEIQSYVTNDKRTTNPYYDVYGEKIDLQARKFLQIVPTFDPGAGQVSQKCRRQAALFYEELKKFSLWALKMFDATAKMPSGLLNGNVNQLGDFDECLGVEGTQGIRGQYCLAYLQLDVEDSRPDLQQLHRLMHSHYAFRSNISDPGHRVPRFGTVNWAVCAPSGCNPRDVEASLRHTLAKHTEQTGLKITVKVDAEMCQVRRTEPLPTETLLVGFFFTAVVVLSIIAGLCDHYKVPASPAVLAFSLKRNVLKLISLERGEGDIATVHGIRALNAFMLILAHKSLALFFNPYTNRTEMTEYVGKPWTVIGRAASLYTDPFIMLSGLLTTYSFVGRLDKIGKLNVRNEYLSRLLRIVPTLGALILFCTYIMPFIGSGPQWNLVVTQHADICKRTWWRNFLFIHNYFGFENMCLTHTHHVGIDTQLFALSPLMVLAIYKKPKIGITVLTLVAMLSTVLRFYVTYFYRLNNYIFFGTSIRQLFDTANLSYILPSHRLTVYIIGVFVGYLLRKWPKSYKLNNTIIFIGWSLCILMAIGAFFGPAGMGSINYVYNPIHAATYNAFAPIGWCAIFIWMTFLSHTGNTDGWLSKVFAWKGFLITTRLSYAIYLTQFPVFFFNVGETRSAEYIGFIRMMLNVKELFWILGASIILTILFETPFQNLRNQYLKRKSLNQTTSKPLSHTANTMKEIKSD
ncbi:PREDICTED: nose resistant to fluoxetine protein 6-like [Ceratosolen solmsi marchali]|uniref:Nose resistant to fluoxetine protein 6-like n=1 Tax=Ceratosolen solmsi marchali TaxID=326594 RepID=A0AAJ6YRB9_9HYME|nr:PREDICTED: nose resistant to fluoxetine protein 6-like [Ceratosolen solmsi marchali]